MTITQQCVLICFLQPVDLLSFVFIFICPGIFFFVAMYSSWISKIMKRHNIEKMCAIILYVFISLFQSDPFVLYGLSYKNNISCSPFLASFFFLNKSVIAIILNSISFVFLYLFVCSLFFFEQIFLKKKKTKRKI